MSPVLTCLIFLNVKHGYSPTQWWEQYEVKLDEESACATHLALTQRSEVSVQSWIKFVLKEPHCA